MSGSFLVRTSCVEVFSDGNIWWREHLVLTVLFRAGGRQMVDLNIGVLGTFWEKWRIGGVEDRDRKPGLMSRSRQGPSGNSTQQGPPILRK